jgi:hypothetical protein
VALYTCFHLTPPPQQKIAVGRFQIFFNNREAIGIGKRLRSVFLAPANMYTPGTRPKETSWCQTVQTPQSLYSSHRGVAVHIGESFNKLLSALLGQSVVK